MRSASKIKLKVEKSRTQRRLDIQNADYEARIASRKSGQHRTDFIAPNVAKAAKMRATIKARKEAEYEAAPREEERGPEARGKEGPE